MTNPVDPRDPAALARAGDPWGPQADAAWSASQPADPTDPAAWGPVVAAPAGEPTVLEPSPHPAGPAAAPAHEGEGTVWLPRDAAETSAPTAEHPAADDGTVWLPRDAAASAPASVRPGDWGTVVNAEGVRHGDWGTVVAGGAPKRPVLPRRERPDLPDSEATPSRARADADRYTAPTPAPVAAPAASAARRRYLPVLVAGLALLALLGLLASWYITRPKPDPRLTVLTASVSAARVTKPDETVKAYFQALQTGTAADVLAFGDPGPGSRALLTDEVLQAARDRAPITELVVSPADPSATTVGVEYKIGGQKQSQQVPVIKRGERWLLDHSTVTVTVSGKHADKIPLLLNGARTDAPAVEVFPGAYTVSTGLPFIAYDDAVSFKVTGLDQKPVLAQLTTKITPAGVQALREAAKASLDTCLAQHELAPANCPFAVQTSQNVKPGSVTRHLDNDPFANFAPLLEPTSSVGAAVVEVRTTVGAQTTGGSTISDPKQNSATLRADLAAPTAAQLSVNWTL